MKSIAAKLNFDETLERLNDQRGIDRTNVLASALRRKVWIAEWHLPGCLSESHAICTSKRDAINAACDMADCGEDGIPHGMKAALRKYGRFDCRTALYGTVVNTVEAHTLAELL